MTLNHRVTSVTYKRLQTYLCSFCYAVYVMKLKELPVDFWSHAGRKQMKSCASFHDLFPLTYIVDSEF